MFEELFMKEFHSSKKEDSNITVSELLEIHRIGIEQWKKEIAQKSYYGKLSRQKGYEKVESLLEKLKIDSKKYFVCLSGGGEVDGYKSGCVRPVENRIRKKRKVVRKKTLNHKTNSDQKRHAITHNKGKYKNKDYLNDKWNLEIKNEAVLIKKSSINSIIRFCSTFSLELIRILKTKNELNNLEEIFRSLSNLKIPESFSHNKQNKFSIRRKEIINKLESKSFTKKEYEEYFKISSSTANRDFEKYEKAKELFSINRNGKSDSYIITLKK
jgi:hypothetical protein